jgi:uncharacterized protein (TIGR03435 family)
MFWRETMRTICAVTLAAVVTIGIHAQDTAAALKFEIVSIHPAPPDARGMGISPRGSRVQIRNATLKFLIQVGWNLQDFSISGGPSWLDERRWDIVATPGGEMARIRPMIQNMLVDRFGLVVHRETREARVYDLVVSKPGRLKAAVPGQSQLMTGLASMTGRGIGTGQLAETLSSRLGLPVIDKTGLTGIYDFDLSWTPDETEALPAKPGVDPVARQAALAAAANNSGASLSMELQDKLGLKLQPGKGPVSGIVVDSAHLPTEN